MVTNDVAPTPPDMHDGCGHAAADAGPVALICGVERSYTTRADISFYATLRQALAAAAACREATSVGHTIVAADSLGRLRARSLTRGGTTPHHDTRKGRP